MPQWFLLMFLACNHNKPIFTTYLNNTCTWEGRGGNAEMSIREEP